MAKNKSVITYLSMGIFPREVLFTCNMKYEDARKYVKRRGYNYSYKIMENNKDVFDDVKIRAIGETIYLTPKDSKRVLWVNFPREFKFTDMDWVELGHEMNHIALFGLDDILDVTREYEAFAYTVSYLQAQAIAAIRGEESTVY